jgi:membrane protease YdiL (CAAX protease family)
MKKIVDFLKANKVYVIILLFVIGVNAAAMLHPPGERSSSEAVSGKPSPAKAVTAAPSDKKMTMFNREDMLRREDQLKELAEKRPALYLFIALFNLLAVFLVFIGCLLDGYWLTRVIRKEPICSGTGSVAVPRWGPVDVFKVVVIFLGLGYAFVICSAFFAKTFPALKEQNFRMIFDTAVMNVLGVAVILYFVMKKYGHSAADLGLSLRNFWKNCLYAALGYLSLLPVVGVIMLATFFLASLIRYEPPVQEIVKIFMEEKSTGMLIFSTLFAAVCGPIAEEFFFRGFMYPAFKKRIGMFRGMLLTSVVFSALHAHWVGLLPIIALGMLLSYLYEKTGSLVTPIVVHVCHNMVMVLLVFFIKWLGV